MAWLLSRSRTGNGPFIGLVLVLFAGAGFIGFAAGEPAVAMAIGGGGLSLAAMLVQVRVAWGSSECLAGLKSSGLLELILITPTKPHEMVDDLGIGLWKRFGNLLIVLAAVQMTMLLAFVISGSDYGGISVMLGGPINLLWAVNLFADFYALGYTGLWFGLKTERAIPAFVRTVLVVFVGSNLVCCGIRFIPNVILIAFMRNRLERGLRELTTSGRTGARIPTQDLLGPSVDTSPAGTPPVIKKPQ